MTNRPHSPLFATINVTGACNLSCTYCFNQPRSTTHMSWEDFERVINELSALSVFFVNLSGGEPFLHPEIEKFIAYAHSKFHHVMVLTNGTVLKPIHIAAIGEIVNSKKTFPIQVSIDAVQPEINMITRGNPEQVIENIKILRDLNADVVVAMVITQTNVDYVVESIIELSQYTRNFHLMTVQGVRGLKGIEEQYQLPMAQYASLWKKIRSLSAERDLIIDTPLDYEGYGGCATGAPCMAAYSHIVVDQTLKVKPCDRLVDVVIGDLNESTILDIWNSETVRPILESSVPFCRT